MEKDKISFFLPTRRGSQRVKNKNTRQFAQYKGGLLENKLVQILGSNLVDEIILSTNDDLCIEIAESFSKKSDRLIIDRRPEYLCLDTTNLEDLISYVPTITEAEHILWGHVTTPLVEAAIYDEAISVYLDQLEKRYDSLVSVTELKNFILDMNGKLINNTTQLPWPRTQDLDPLYEINHAIFLASRYIYINMRNRLGKNPYLHKMSKIESLDVDWEEDFLIAEQLYIQRESSKIING